MLQVPLQNQKQPFKANELSFYEPIFQESSETLTKKFGRGQALTYASLLEIE
jgi:hypothetical protein